MGLGMESSDVNMNAKSMPMHEYQPMAHQQGHATVPSMRRHPTQPVMDPHIQMFTTPPPMFPVQNPPCYACLSGPVTGVQSRYPR